MHPTARLLLPLLFALLLPVAAFASPPVVLFDEGHGQMFFVGQQGPLQLSDLAALFNQAGCEVRTSRAPLNDATLAGAAALVSSGPFAPFSAEEGEAVGRFLESGGRMAVLLHIGPPASGLLGQFGVSHSNGVLREHRDVLHDQPLDFWVSDLEPHPVFAGVERFALFGGWALVNDGAGARVIARTGPGAWVDLDRDEKQGAQDPAQAFGVAVAGERGKGGFVVFGDDAIFQNRYLEEYNGPLGRNLVRWLCGQ